MWEMGNLLGGDFLHKIKDGVSWPPSSNLFNQGGKASDDSNF